MSFLNLPWQWDSDSSIQVPVGLTVKRWRRGPLTFYRYEWHFPALDIVDRSYFVCFADNWSIGISFPSRLPEETP